MTPAFYHLVRMSQSLQSVGPDPAALLAKLPTASSGESVMIRAALSLIPSAWLAEDGIEAPPFRLDEVSSLDFCNTQALIEAVAAQSGHGGIV